MWKSLSFSYTKWIFIKTKTVSNFWICNFSPFSISGHIHLHLRPPPTENFSRWIFISCIISLSLHFFPIYFFHKLTARSSGLFINFIVYLIVKQEKIVCKAINESTVPNANANFECCRTWANKFGIGVSLFFLHNLYDLIAYITTS